MIREALAQIKNISNLLTDPNRAERAMCKRLVSCIKLCKKVLTRNMLSVLYRSEVSTQDVE